MLPRVLLTAASLTVAAAAAALVDCTVATLELFGGDPIGICDTATSMGMTEDVWVGVGLILMALLSLAWTWIPSLRPGEKRRRLSPTRSLERNLARIPEVGGEVPEPPEPTESEARLADLERRLEAVETSLGADVPSREATERWMDLLREANDLHNSSELSTPHFKRVNTRLLDLFTEPSRALGA